MEEHLRDDHGRPDTCLKLLPPGEAIMYPEYRVSQEVAEEIEAIMAAERNPPSCRKCHNLLKSSWRFETLWMPKDVNILAHHMRTK